MNINRAMKSALSETQLDCSLNPSLKSIADSGFVLRNGCYVIRGLSKTTNVKRESFPDRTGYECFLNSLHVEDYDSVSPLAQAILLVKEVFAVWNAEQRTERLTAIVSADEFSVVTKFHGQRLGEQWLNENVEGYDDPVMSINSDEDIVAQIAVAR